MTKVRTSQLAQTGAVTGNAIVWDGFEWRPGQFVDLTRIPLALVDVKGDLIVATGPDVVARQAVGPNGQVLTADSTTTTGVKWALANDATRIPLSIVDVKGDLIVGFSDDAVVRLPVGTTGQMLTVDPVTNSGLRWTDLAIPDATQIAFTPFGTLEATNVQAALEELSTEGGSGGGGGGGGGHVVQDEGVVLEQRAGLNFVGAGVEVTDDPAGNRTIVSISGTDQTILPARTTATYTTAVLPSGQTETGVIEMAPGWRLYRIATNRTGRVRLYDSTASRDADLSRAAGVDPAIGAGVMLDYVTTTGRLNVPLSPLVDGYVASGTSAGLSVTNHGAAGALTVTLTYVRTE